MSTVMYFDFDGVLNPIPYQKVWVGPPDAGYSDWEMLKPSNWSVEELPIDPEVYFVPDHEERVTVPSDYPGYKDRQYIIRWSSELLERITALVDSGAAEFRWLTTWRHNANSILAPTLGLPSSWLSLTWEEKMSDYSQVFKMVALERVVEPDLDRPQQAWDQSDLIDLAVPDLRPFVWVDDVATARVENFSGDNSHLEYIDSRSVFSRLPMDSLIIQTQTAYGVSRAHMDAIEKFVLAHQ